MGETRRKRNSIIAVILGAVLFCASAVWLPVYFTNRAEAREHACKHYFPRGRPRKRIAAIVRM